MKNKKTEQLSLFSLEEMRGEKKSNDKITQTSSVVSFQKERDKRQKEYEAEIYRGILSRIDHLVK